jgi:chorismate lyase/3-hydroxybenzoate synthase
MSTYVAVDRREGWPMTGRQERSLWVRLCRPSAGGDGRYLLGRVRYGGDEAVAPASGPPQVWLPLPQLGAAGHVEERWSSPRRPRYGRLGEVAFAHDGAVLFGAVRAPGESAGLCAETCSAYRRVLAAIEAQGYPHLLRVWACVPGINDDEDWRERYKAFCQGRSRALAEAWGGALSSRVCASTAVGSDRGGLTLHFLAGRQPGEHRENPRQVAAWAYPVRFGAGSPAFSRATVAPSDLSSLLFVSGTASIVGHDSAHSRDAKGQLEETLANLQVLLDTGGPAARGGAARPELLKVYLREAVDLEWVRPALERRFPGVPCLYLQAAICRAELALEIEAVAAPG